ncbi:MAG TPA: patatin-like phospholipase family protein [Gemmatimonadaceae bacterium]|jgi:NTE family protein|nr:patatin-like phospholipase family protein [Gemmatimonadaceae bacterium]
MTGEKKRVALVIGAGSVKCAAALGLWKVLAREGIELDMVVGCSGGSLYAATMALGYDVQECEAMTLAMWNRKVTERRDWASMLGAFLPKLFKFNGHFGMVHGEPLIRALRTPFGEKTFADTKIPLYIVATELLSGQQATLSEGRIVDAVRASIAIPYIWAPWEVDGKLMLDGCLSAPLPVDVAIKEGADVILAMGFESPYPRKIRSATSYAFHVNSIYTNNLFRANYSFHNLAHHAEILPIVPEFGEPVNLFDTHKFAHVIACGERAAEEQLPYLRQLLGLGQQPAAQSR